MGVNKRGIVMVYVLVFVVFSQLIYWGLLRINQVNSKRYIDYQSHYQANIQEKMTLNLIQHMEADHPRYLEAFINHEKMEAINSMKIAYGGEWVDVSPNAYIHFGLNEDRETAVIYLPEVYLSLDLLNYCLEFEGLACAGYRQSNKEPIGFSASQEIYYNPNRLTMNQITDLVHQSILDLGYRYNGSFEYRTQLYWDPPQKTDLVVRTNNGVSYYQHKLNNSTLQTMLEVRSFQRLFKINAFDQNVLIYWRASQYEKLTPD